MKKFAVIGLGTFGKSLAMELAESDAEVLAIDISEERINEISHPNITAVKFDSTDIKELERFGIKDTDAVIVTIGENFEALLLTCVLLKELGVKRIIARANEEIHKKILKSIGIREEDIITPEEEVAKRLSKLLLSEGFIEFFEITKDYEIAWIKAPKSFLGKTIRELELRQNYNVLLVTVIRNEKTIGVLDPDTTIEQNDELLIFGRDKDIKKIIHQSNV
ncbi:trk system potassium uptake protein TrkA [Candidatus Kryptonium thompsonii]|uniref:Trk system potassium uptake protein TrkA n=1 Tax=Candidatus Kryptonium thompsonii TaxID=1633631 RepID=A0A0P1LPK4_9BACT|nr:TrkA family potassium uptake protein [Candidatus Kryptonium thompsoni]CUS77777.1 trk system potassium uptake protein TrkA [Candidatus Kryptonium thompsoni]CUS78332.1 trk system potassium uptake protein TrkA [Candidatus Kryptonium thompsoni]CUS82168.1 trk system potassium uptake protein TrkA [Candidatus Kryptonium thompsoni]CUS83892.1 trk system potassium uptake protein TrkA [Candidatus Kryptonium thompsoni]CUS91296.1 trk system potassium uptake protein TrkA [Candidatus Kryptonium thompsoni]